MEVMEYCELVEMKRTLSNLRAQTEAEFAALSIEHLELLVNELLRLRIFHQKAYSLAMRGSHFLAIELNHPKIKQIYQLVREGDQQTGNWTAENELDYQILLRKP